MYGLNSDFQKRNVAIYARVSTEHEAQLSALENQLDWYKPILEMRPEWTLTAQYIDEGITGTSAEKRPQFMRMIEDAKLKKFNMIITREVSRFARNTVDTLQYTRKLKEYGVEVYFINDNIKTFDGDGELRLTIMATLAQDESRKTSIRVKAGQQTSMNNGVYYGTGNILGYDRIGKDMVINKEQAETVRMIYDMYLSGMGVTKIQYELERLSRLTSTGKKKWHSAYITKMLKNSFYCGIITYHKEYTPDYLKQKKVKNYGEVEFTKVKGRHTPIVTEDEYNRVLEIMSSRTKIIKSQEENNRIKKAGSKPHTTVWGRLLECQCGRKFYQHFHSRADRQDGYNYYCYNAANNGSYNERKAKGLSLEDACDSPYIPGWKLDMMAKRIFSEYIRNAPEVLELAYKMLEEHISDTQEKNDRDELIRKKNGEIEKLSNRRNNLIEMRADGDIDKESFRAKKSEIDQRVAALTLEIEELSKQEENKEKEDCLSKLKNLRKKLEEYTSFCVDNLPEKVIEAFIEKIWVSKDEFRWYIRTGVKNPECEPVKVGAFVLTIEDAKKHQYAISTKKRVYKWFDLNVSVWV